MGKIPDWREDVYHVSKFPKDSKEYWERIREYIIDRDGHRCQACRKQRRVKHFTVHHIVPRIEGGTEDPDNLITLCIPCHDFVEASPFRTLKQIINCTRYLEEDEMQRVVLSDNMEFPSVNQPSLDVEQNQKLIDDDDEVKILCPCGIYHVRQKSLIGTKIITINCVCKDSATFLDGNWVWKSLIPKPPKPEKVLKPERVKKTRKKTKPVKPVEQFDIHQCPLCLIEQKYSLGQQFITCVCGNQAMRSPELDGVIWFGQVKLIPNVYRR